MVDGRDLSAYTNVDIAGRELARVRVELCADAAGRGVVVKSAGLAGSRAGVRRSGIATFDLGCQDDGRLDGERAGLVVDVLDHVHGAVGVPDTEVVGECGGNEGHGGNEDGLELHVDDDDVWWGLVITAVVMYERVFKF